MIGRRGADGVHHGNRLMGRSGLGGRVGRYDDEEAEHAAEDGPHQYVNFDEPEHRLVWGKDVTLRVSVSRDRIGTVRNPGNSGIAQPRVAERLRVDNACSTH